jgi:uncharacterized protein (TIGR03067 family)
MMKWRCLTLAVCVILPVCAQEAEPTPPDAKRIQGTWAIVKGLKEGKPAPKDMMDARLTFDDKKITVTLPAGRAAESPATYKLDTKKKPTEIDIVPVGTTPPAMGGGAPPAPPVVLGIYKFEKDELTLVFGQPGGERPKAFDDKAASVMVLRREKKEKEKK